MAITAAQLNIKVGADTAAAQAGLRETGAAANSAAGGFKMTLGGMLKMAAGLGVLAAVAAAARFVVNQFKDVIAAGMSEQNMIAETTNTLSHMGSASGQTAKSIGDFADSMSMATGISNDLIQHGEDVMLTFANIGPKAFDPATTAAINMSVLLKGDLQSSIVMVGKALNDPLKGLTALSRVGVSFTDAEKKSITTMMAHNNIAGAQAIIMSELTKQFGGAAVAAGTTFQGQVARMNATLDIAKEKIGMALIPVLQKMLGAIVPIAFSLMNKLIPAAEGFASTLSTNLGPEIANVAGFIVSDVVPALSAMWLWFSAKVLPVLGTLVGVVQHDVLPSFLAIWGALSKQLIPILQGLWAKISPFLIPAIKELGAIIKTPLTPAIVGIINFAGTLVTGIGNLINWINKWKGVFITIAGVVLTIFAPALVGMAAQALATGITIGASLIPTIIGMGASMAAAAIGGIASAITGLIAYAVAGWAAAAATIAATWPILLIIAAIAGLIAIIILVVTHWKEITNFLTGVAVGAFQAINDAISNVGGAFNKVIGIIQNFLNMLGGIKNAVGGALGSIGNLIGKIPGFASGGVMPHSGLAMVGESGPEVVALPAGARVFPSGRGPSAGGSGNSYHVHVTNQSPSMQQIMNGFRAMAVLHG